MNTANSPKTIHDTPGICCSIMKLEPNPMTPGSKFHNDLMTAKSKAQVIDLLCTRGSAMGWFSDMPPGLFDKLQGMRQSQQAK